MIRFVKLFLVLFLITLVNSTPLMMNKRQFATPILLLTNQESLNAENEAANLNQIDVSATNENEFASNFDFDQANNLVVSKRNIIPYAELNNVPYSLVMIKRDIIPDSNLDMIQTKRNIADQDKRNINERTKDIEKRLVGVGSIPATLGLIGTGTTITNALPFLVGEDIFGGTSGVSGLVRSEE